MECNKWGRWWMKFTIFFVFLLIQVFGIGTIWRPEVQFFGISGAWMNIEAFLWQNDNYMKFEWIFIVQYSIVFWKMKFLNLTRLGSTSTGKNIVLARIQNLIFLKFFYPVKIFYDQTNFWTWINDNFIASDFLEKQKQ